MENQLHQDERYLMAQKKVKSIKGFYSHLFFYLVINAIIIVQIYLKTGSGFWDWENFHTPLFWGIGLLAHGLSVFARNITFTRNWEERKIQQFMEKEKTKKWE